MSLAELVVLLVPLVLAGVVVVAIVVHGRIARRAVELARQEDLLSLVRESGSTLSGLLRAARGGRAVDAAVTAWMDQEAGRAGGGEVVR
ncbi:hypothetical protein [Streptomyces sp. NPDC007205]|uniref:hypothetical protein n=1 Tax=Streptomyces sp. NPDC007205 TaxID=3154316 RepID=UPI0033DE451D